MIILNDRDTLLQATTIRLVSIPDPANLIVLSSDKPLFSVLNGIVSPGSINITARLSGALVGIPTFTIISGASSITQSTIDYNAVANLLYTNLTSESAEIQASLNFLGITYTSSIIIGGSTAIPSNVVLKGIAPVGSLMKISWQKSRDSDIKGYEVRSTNTNWGGDDAYLFRGNTDSCFLPPGAVNILTTWYVKAYDISGLYSTISTAISYTVAPPITISGFTYTYADTSLTASTITLSWDAPLNIFGNKEYRVYNNTIAPEEFISTPANSITLPAAWVGINSFSVLTVDLLGNQSMAFTQDVAKFLPGPVTGIRYQVVDNNILLYWSMPVKTSLPIDHVLIKKGAVYSTAETIGINAGEFTAIQEISGGTYTYWIRSVDTDNKENEVPQSVEIKVNQPIDYQYFAELNSTLSGTKVNAVIKNDSIILPVNVTEAWENHFVNNSWTTPAQQIAAGLPIYIQPGVSSGYYEEIFNFGTIISSSNITIDMVTTNIYGNANIATSISVSSDGISYSTPQGGLSVVKSAFQYVKVNITATATATGDIVSISSLSVRLDVKLKTDSFTQAIYTGGTVVNFNTEFLDISSIIVTAAESAPRLVVYNFKDTVLAGTYTVVSNVLTVNITAHGMINTQNIRLAAATGSLPIGVYSILSSTTNTFTCNTISANSSGSLTMYPNSMILYMFNSAGTPQSGSVSWLVRGS